MVHLSYPAPTSGLAIPDFRAAARRIGKTIVTAVTTDRRLTAVRELQSLSDAQLARRGLTRDGILRHVFDARYFG